MRNLSPHARPAESKSAFEQDLQVICVQNKVRSTHRFELWLFEMGLWLTAELSPN